MGRKVGRSLEFRLLDQADKIRLVLVGFFLLTLFSAPREQILHFNIAATVLTFAALLAVFSHFLLNWQIVRREGQVHLMAALLVCTDILCISMFTWAMGPPFHGLAVLLLLDVVFAAAFFMGIEALLVTGLVCGAHVVLHFANINGNAMWQMMVGSLGTTIVVAWLAYALAEVGRRERATTERIVTHLTEGILLITAQGEIIVANPRIEHMVGISADQVIGLNIFDPESRELLAPLNDIIADVPSHGSADAAVRTRQVRVENPSPMDVECLTIPCAMEGAQNLAWVVVCKDITALLDTVRGKEEGLALLSHELRGRLQSVRASSELLVGMADSLPSERRDEILKILDVETRRLSTLLTRTLDAAGLEQGTIIFNFQPVDLVALIQEAAVGLRAHAEARDLQLEVECRGQVRPVNGDRARLDQVVQNLLENAIKFTPPGGRILITAAEVAEGDSAMVSVCDTGCGVASEERETIFEKFARGRSATNGQHPQGLGLGLHICRRIISAHSGTIGVESGQDWGSIFYFTVPLAAQASPTPEPAGVR